MEEVVAAAEVVVVTPREVLGKASQVRAGRGAYVAPHNNLVYASVTGFCRTLSPPPNSPDQRSTVEVTGHKAHSALEGKLRESFLYGGEYEVATLYP